MNTTDKLQVWLKEGETGRLEFKPAFNQDTIETLAAFANAKGGSVLLGVSDTGEILGVKLAKESINQWINEIKSKTSPQLVPDAETIETDGKTIVRLAIVEYPVKPVSCKGRYYKRIANTNHLLNLNEIVNIHIQTINSSWDYYLDPNHSISDISEEKALRLISLYNKHRIFPIEPDVPEFLSKMELMREGKITHAAFLLLMKNDSIASSIELGRFHDDITIKDGITISSDLVSEIDSVLAFITKHINKEFIITGNLAREERWDYPLDALREIIMNMIIHRDYTHHGDSSVKIYNNRIEFFNPGHLPDSISVEDLLEGNYVSDCRNKLISKIFKEINWIEKYGSGIKRINNLFKEYGSPLPLFENFQHGFRVTVYSLNTNVTENVPENVPKNVLENVPENRGDKILEILRINEKTTLPELAMLFGVNLKTIKRDIEKLKEKGLIERIGPDKGGYWKVL